MRVPDYFVNLILSNAEIEYNGCHNSDPQNPLWGRNAYFMVDGHKITFPVKSIEPNWVTLDIGLYKELKRRIEYIEHRIEFDHYTQVQMVQFDPYSMRSLVEKHCGVYYDVSRRWGLC